jgi:hypothetical protein
MGIDHRDFQISIGNGRVCQCVLTLLLPNFRRNAKTSIRNSHYGNHATSINDGAGGCSHNAVTQDCRSCRLICSEEGYLAPSA